MNTTNKKMENVSQTLSVGSITETYRNISDIWDELTNHPDYITTGPEKLFTVQSLVECFRSDWESDNEKELTDKQVDELEKMIIENKENISDTIWEFFQSPLEYSHWKDDCDEYEQFMNQ